MIDLQTEKLLTFPEVCQHLPRRRRGRKLHISTLYRWWKDGLRGARLEVTSVGGSPATSLEALGRFFAAIAAAKNPEQPAPPATKFTPAARTRTRKQHARDVERELQNAGL